MAEQYRVTSVGAAPAEDRAHRMRAYFIMMTIRIACVASLFFVHGWWVLLSAAGAIILPYFAVLIANAVSTTDGERPDAPSPLQLESAEPPAETDEAADEDPAETLIVIDAPAERRSARPSSASTTDGGDQTGATA
ncbi:MULTISPECIES: DUF3099 domain-containing protein [Leucobacter]|uniref:DUF3099 domain-containing protein n=1 Tax=Leucobacter iarius TaxID=333963 RepID=A0ABN2LMP8_9MICO|nr:DUF3099 domain-containing protein [Leucobacter sp. Ag1]KKI16592.1 hypothetical protein XM48_15105 [Leucobacter sp. Ag1]